MVLRRENVFHLVERVHRETKCNDFVLTGGGALIATAKKLPGSLMLTDEVDLYARDAADPEAFEARVIVMFGQGSIYSDTYKYYADVVTPRTAIMPSD